MSHLIRTFAVMVTLVAATSAAEPPAASDADADFPQLVSSEPRPLYPPDLYRRGIFGRVELIIEIDDAGAVTATRVDKSSGHREFDDSAVAAVKQWKFSPMPPGRTRKIKQFRQTVRFEPQLFRPGTTVSYETESTQPQWKQLASLPDERGFAGQFVGMSQNRLLLYGGTNFPGKPVWEGGVKKWYRDVFALDDLDAEWKKIGELPGERAVGYGVALSGGDGILCLGGADDKRHHADCFLLNYDGTKLTTTDLPPLPQTCAYMCGAKFGYKVYVAGGLEKPDSQRTMKTFWCLDLERPSQGWQALPTWPGPPRQLAVAAMLGGSFYLMSGCDLYPGPDATPLRQYLRDMYRYDPGSQKWTKLADVPTSVVAAPSPAMSFGDRIVVFGGDDSTTLGFRPPEKHPGFPRNLWSYDVERDRWTRVGEPQFIPVAVPLVEWKRGWVAASGEIRPAVRSREVWYLRATPD